MWSFVDRLLLLFEDGVTFTRTEGLRDSAWLPFPPSKYSINKDVWLLLEPRPLCCFFVGIVTGLPSDGKEYVVFSVTLDSTSVPPVLLSVSVGAGSGGAFRESTPILAVKGQIWDRAASDVVSEVVKSTGFLRRLESRIRLGEPNLLGLSS